MTDQPADPTPSNAYTTALDQTRRRRRTETAPELMAEQLRNRFAQEVLDTLVCQELGKLSTEPELSGVEVPTITVDQILETMKARAARADA